jgi:hypothetical protein
VYSDPDTELLNVGGLISLEDGEEDGDSLFDRYMDSLEVSEFVRDGEVVFELEEGMESVGETDPERLELIEFDPEIVRDE